MSTHERAEWARNAREAFDRADWESLLPQLLRGARHYLHALGLAAGEDYQPSLVEAQELVDLTVLACLEGRRCGPLGAATAESEVVAYLSMTMRSCVTNLRTRAENDLCAGDEVLPWLVDEGPSIEERLVARAELAEVLRRLEGDDDLLALCREMAEGAAPNEELGEALHWTTDQVRVVRRRMRRHFTTSTIPLDDEAEPPSSSARWRQHDDRQAPGERRGAAREPDRRARRTGRRGG